MIKNVSAMKEYVGQCLSPSSNKSWAFRQSEFGLPWDIISYNVAVDTTMKIWYLLNVANATTIKRRIWQ